MDEIYHHILLCVSWFDKGNGRPILCKKYAPYLYKGTSLCEEHMIETIAGNTWVGQTLS